MSVTDKNPNLLGALSLSEIVPGMDVLVVSIREREYFNASVVSVDVASNDIDLRYNYAKVGSLASDATTLGVTPDADGDWAQYCLSETDNPALEGFMDYETGKSKKIQVRTDETLTSESWFYYTNSCK